MHLCCTLCFSEQNNSAAILFCVSRGDIPIYSMAYVVSLSTLKCSRLCRTSLVARFTEVSIKTHKTSRSEELAFQHKGGGYKA